MTSSRRKTHVDQSRCCTSLPLSSWVTNVGTVISRGIRSMSWPRHAGWRTPSRGSASARARTMGVASLSGSQVPTCLLHTHLQMEGIENHRPFLGYPNSQQFLFSFFHLFHSSSSCTGFIPTLIHAREILKSSGQL